MPSRRGFLVGGASAAAVLAVPFAGVAAAQQTLADDHGLIGDGVTDNKRALATLLQDLPPDSTVRFRPGVYRFSGNVPIDKAVTLRSNGGARLVLDAAAPAGAVILSVNAPGVRLHGMAFTVEGTPGQVRCVRILETSDTEIWRCSFLGDGVYLQGAVDGVSVDRCRFEGGAFQLLTANSSVITDLRVTRNRFVGTPGVTWAGIGIDLPNTPGGSGGILIEANTVSGNRVPEANRGLGIALARVTGATVRANVVSDCLVDGIHLEDGCTDVEVTGNRVSGCELSAINVISGAGPSRCGRIAVRRNLAIRCATDSSTGHQSAIIGLAQSSDGVGPFDSSLVENVVADCGNDVSPRPGLAVGNRAERISVTGNSVGRHRGPTGTPALRLGRCVDTTITRNRLAADVGTWFTAPDGYENVRFQSNRILAKTRYLDLPADGVVIR